VSSDDPSATAATIVTAPETVDAEEARSFTHASRVGRYVVVGHLGTGGMGEVLAGYDPELDRRVALKLIRSRSRTGDAAQARLVREAQALAKLSHPNVVAVFDVGTHEDHVFIAMEHISGRTLKAWLAEGPHPWRQTVELMLAAGRGLSAAHAVGLVHRDFKPGNVMIGDEPHAAHAIGRVRVLDFGLARLAYGAHSSDRIDEAERSPDTSGPGQLSRDLTETGIVMGTPAYMAPEQFLGGAIDPRTDQFAFCVVLFGALFGSAPFPGKTFEEIGRAVTQGGPVAMPASSGVPRRIRAAIGRGLSVAANERFASMNELLAELERGLGQGRRRLAIALATAGTLAVGAAIAWARAPQEPPCSGLERQLDGTWDDERRAAVERSLLSTDVAYAADAAARVRQELDAFAASWLQARVDACEATRVRGDLSERLMDLRVVCLQRQRDRLGAAVDLLTAADLQVVRHAVDVAQELPDVSACSDIERLTHDLEPPEDARAGAEVEALRAELARSDVLSIAGKYDEATRLLEGISPRVKAVAYAPLEAELMVRLGILSVQLGHAEAALAVLDEALWIAIASGHARVEAEALIGITHVLGNNRPADALALRIIRNTQAVLQRLGDPPDLAARAAQNAATVHVRRREPEKAVAGYRRAIELTATYRAAQGVRISATANLAMALAMSGESDAALEAAREALEGAQERLGTHHPSVATIRHNLGTMLGARGEHTAAIEELQLALEINRAALGPGHTEIGKNLQNLAISQVALGRLDDALESSSQALEIKRATLGPTDPSLAGAVNNHGDTLLRLGRPREAIEYFEEAGRIWGESPDRIYALVGRAEAWLALGEPARGAPLARDAITLMDTATFPDIERAQLSFVAARVLWAADTDRAEARRLAEQARAAYGRAQGDHRDAIARIDAWLDDPS
jgi:tetratricopeptide (TPR) repeat protein